MRGLTPRVSLPCWLYWELYRLRNDFVHGNPIGGQPFRPGGTNVDLFWIAPVLYRLALTGFLNLSLSHPEPGGEDWVPVAEREEPNLLKRNESAKHSPKIARVLLVSLSPNVCEQPVVEIPKSRERYRTKSYEWVRRGLARPSSKRRASPSQVSRSDSPLPPGVKSRSISASRAASSIASNGRC